MLLQVALQILNRPNDPCVISFCQKTMLPFVLIDQVTIQMPAFGVWLVATITLCIIVLAFLHPKQQHGQHCSADGWGMATGFNGCACVCKRL